MRRVGQAIAHLKAWPMLSEELALWPGHQQMPEHAAPNHKVILFII